MENLLVKEEWRIIADAPDYQVSNLGNVRNAKLAKKAVLTNRVPENMIPFKNGGGYLRIKVENKYGRLTNVSINRAVAFAFLGTPMEKNYMVNHKNMNKRDNKLENLEWLSPSENARHAIVNGTRRQKFDDHTIRTIRDMYATSGISASALGRLYNVTVTTISKIITRVSYASVV